MAGKLGCSVVIAWTFLAGAAYAQEQASHPVFATASQCIACHSNMTDADGSDVGIGHAWSGTMMALSAKDPYWMAAVRREIADRPEQRAFIEDKCSVCHMPAARTMAVAAGGNGEILKYLEAPESVQNGELASDGVTCTVCHQISAANLGDRDSFDGGYVINTVASGDPSIYGPLAVDAGRERIMNSAAAFLPEQSLHIQASELCATCHTLFTPAVDGQGNNIGEFPEQTPYLEWRHSEFHKSRSCQDCHMPTTTAPISSVLGEPRDGMSQHAFRGGNAFMIGLIDKYREDLGVTTPSVYLQRSKKITLDHLQTSTAAVEIQSVKIIDDSVHVTVRVENFGGHKLPTAYPSRRVWLNLSVTDQSDALLFESGAMMADGSIAGNDNDKDAAAFEPHYEEITRSDQVQIYEPIIEDYSGTVTTGLLSAVRYAKDNRLLPAGFDKSSADEAIAVQGGAIDDIDFVAGSDTIRYRIDIDESVSSVNVSVRLLFQTVGYRWARNLAAYDATEAQRFVEYFESNAGNSAVILSAAHAAGDSE